MQFFEVNKKRPLSKLIETAKEMIRQSLPIKCLEAVILAIYLTNPLKNVERFAISFKTAFEGSGSIHRHIVLGVYHNGKYGALGLSRRKDLMFKALTYDSLSDLVDEFANCYVKNYHGLLKVRLSPPIQHDHCNCERIVWNYLNIDFSKRDESERKKELSRFCREMKNQVCIGCGGVVDCAVINLHVCFVFC